MKKLTMTVVISLFAGHLCVQAQQAQQLDQIHSKPKTTIWKGTLVDSGCPSQTERRNSSSTNRDNTTDSSASQSGSDSATTTSYALVTEDGKCMPFDLDSNEKVSGLVKIGENWSENTGKNRPTKVEVIGTKTRAGTISVDDIVTEPASESR